MEILSRRITRKDSADGLAAITVPEESMQQMMLFARRLILASVVALPTAAWAAHPLITDDTGTQGTGKFQLEINGQYDSDKENVNGVSVRTTGGQAAATLSYGFVDSADLALSVPYLWNKVKRDGVLVSNDDGISDTIFEIKWRFFEQEGLSFAAKPGISFPTGNEHKGLGMGRTGYHVFIIGSQEAAPWAFHVNAGYVRNEKREDERTDLWHASLAAAYDVIKNLKLVGNIGIERNADKASDNEPAFLLGGVIYTVTEDFDIDFGVKSGMTTSEADLSLLAGTTLRF
ncbi:MAG: transporter [Betaproteobacteria bacterium]